MDTQDEARAAFEELAFKHYLRLEKEGDGYLYKNTNTSWKFWKAGRASAQCPNVVTTEVKVPDDVLNFLRSKDLYQVLMDVQNGIDSPALMGIANSLIIQLDKLLSTGWPQPKAAQSQADSSIGNFIASQESLPPEMARILDENRHELYGSASPQPVAGVSDDDTPDDIRAAGWAVAVHNDYRLNGEPHTFWLFTKGDRAVKGEGKTDAEALNQVRAILHTSPQPPAQEVEELRAAWIAACEFIDSHVADPDITEKMRTKYAIFLHHKAIIDAAMKNTTKGASAPETQPSKSS